VGIVPDVPFWNGPISAPHVIKCCRSVCRTRPSAFERTGSVGALSGLPTTRGPYIVGARRCT
jgi:hypothetical protein